MKKSKNDHNYQSGDENLLGGYITQEKAMQLLNVGYTTLYNIRKRGLVKHSRIGSKIFYDLNSIKGLLGGNSEGQAV